ncbi:MAG: hypothetical protein IPJ87_17165 [Flavobacteriales bacterium]|nr:hypothetical protein [Flavobacteriales bacterium]MBK7943576.1 hypothetical protein [Flavobacteriales bacterium]MBK9699739.1 hypothetical protein [Flavobacteriales bacterium]
MHRHRTLLVIAGLIMSTAAASQCSITWAHLTPLCEVGGVAKVVGAVHWTGGTPPYSVIISGTDVSIQVHGIGASPLFLDETMGNFTSLVGATATVTDAGGCFDSSPMQNLGSFTAIGSTGNLFTLTLAATNCAAGIFTASFTDNTLQEADLFGEPLTGYTYTLRKNGSVLATGSLTSVLQSSPARLVFGGLTYGQYDLELGLTTGSGQTVQYCPDQPVYAFCVPKANDCQTNVSVRVALASVLGSGGLMSDGLRTAGLLPLSEPYSALGYTYVGTAPGTTTTAGVLAVTGNDAIVDWVVVELRNNTTPTTIVASRPALLQRDGDVVDLDGDPYVSFPVAAGLYKVAVRHRNHLGVMTSAGFSLNNDPCRGPKLMLPATGTYGTNARRQMTVPGVTGSLMGLWPGEATGDGVVKYTGGGNDRDAILQAIGGTTLTNTVNSVYDRRDVNLDGSIKYTGSANDRDVILQTIGGTVPTATRTQQLP